MKKQRANIGFGEELEQLDPTNFQPSKGQGTTIAPPVPKEEIKTVAEENGFTSREAPPKQNKIKETRTRFVHRTGRDAQFNNKVHPEVKKAYENIRGETGKPMGLILEEALTVYQRELQGAGSQASAK
ncbi:MAG: hypothetical protein KC643_11840 [Nitrospira sp.]|nr:hypothetical protein [Nitrospira sp.]